MIECRAFTLIEIMVVIALFTLLSGFAAVASLDSYRGNAFLYDRDLFVSLLQRARALSQGSTCVSSGCTDAKPHGVHIEATQYVLFEGAGYDPANSANAAFAASPTVTRGGGDIIFAPLSATTTGTSTSLSDATHRSVISVGANGRISWTN